MRLFLSLLWVSVVMATGWVESGRADQLPEILFVQIPNDSTPHLPSLYLPSNRYTDGMRIVRYHPNTSPKGPVVLTPGFVSACDPAVSFDGQHILFAGKKQEQDRWQIWQLDREGNNLKQITHSRGNCVSPLYVGNLFHLDDAAPTEQIVYVSDEAGWINEIGAGPGFALYAARKDGSQATRITWNLSSDYAPDVLPNGRLVYSSWRWSGQNMGKQGRFSLMAVNIDGTDLMPFYGNHEEPFLKEMIHISPPQGRAYFIETSQASGLGGGDLSFVTLRRPLHSHQVLSPAKRGLYHSPCSYSNSGLIASYRDNREGTSFALYSIDVQSGKRGKKIYGSDDWHCVDTQILAPHPKVKGRSSVVNLSQDKGIFFCLNVYNSLSERLPQGSVKRLRVVEGLPVKKARSSISNNKPFGPKRILGYAPVEEDGSFHIEVPAHTPLSFQLLNDRGMAVAKQESWTWVVPREWRGCIGCHEDRELSPPNELVQAVIRPAVKLTLPPSKRRTVDFVHDIKPILETRCSTMGCHTENGSSPNLDANATVRSDLHTHEIFLAYQNLVSPSQDHKNTSFVVPGSALKSPLVGYLSGERNRNDEGTTASSILSYPHSNPLLSEEETALLIEWIDLGALYDVREWTAAFDGQNTNGISQ